MFLPLKTVIEGLLFVSDTPLGVDKMVEIIGDESVDALKVEASIGDLNEEYKMSGRAFLIREVADGYQLRTVVEMAPYALKLKRNIPAKLTKAALETLAVIAYRQPVLRAEIEKVRGVDVGGNIKNLLDKDLIRISSRRDNLPGKPMLYATTKKFLEVFELNDLNSLPTIEEIKKICPPDQPRLF
jgi:segregation and condensation protein B